MNLKTFQKLNSKQQKEWLFIENQKPTISSLKYAREIIFLGIIMFSIMLLSVQVLTVDELSALEPQVLQLLDLLSILIPVVSYVIVLMMVVDIFRYSYAAWIEHKWKKDNNIVVERWWKNIIKKLKK
jgi:hypothetical protein